MISLCGETVSEWPKTSSMDMGLADLHANQNPYVNLLFVRYELINEGVRLGDLFVWQLSYLLLDYKLFFGR